MSTSSTNKLFERLDADDPAARAVVFELHASVGLREDGVVLAQPGVEAGLKTAAALPHDDRAAGDDVAVVRLDAEPLRVGVAAVPRAALSFFMSHCCISGRGWVLVASLELLAPSSYRRMSLTRTVVRNER